VVETITIDGTAYTVAELEALLGIERLEPPYDTAELQRLLNDANQDSSSPMAELLAALVLLALVPAMPRGRIAYITQQQQYYQGTRPLTQPNLNRRIFAETQQNATRHRRRTQDLIDGRISLEQWQRQSGADIVRSQFRMAQGGAGTAQRLTPQHLEALRQRIAGELGSLAGVADALRAGEMSPKMALYRAGRWGTNAGAAFWEAQHVTHSDGRWLARRVLDPSALHCPSCPNHSTGGQWIPAEQVVPVGSDCECRGRCRCSVEYRPVTLSDRLPL
jgi:hypothetical protein